MEAQSSRRTDFFITYNQADRDWAEWVEWNLIDEGYTVVSQTSSFPAGSNFILEMHRAAEQAEKTIVILSPTYLAARFTQPEWAAMIARDPTGSERRLVPIRVAPCEPPGLLRAITYIDLVETDEPEARRRLLSELAGSSRRSTPFPGRRAPSHSGFPGTVPSIWNVPFSRNPNFVGREDLLVELRNQMGAGSPAALVQMVAGLGGVGKTQLALEYCYAFAREYAVVWWIRAEEPAVLESEYCGLGARLSIQAGGQMLSATREALGRSSRWLLVFDNAENPDDLERFLPQTGGHVIITSRNPNWRRIARTLTVPVLTSSASIEFLLTRTGLDDRAAAADLAKRFGGLPLALEQAAAYIEAHGITLADYLATFDDRLMNLLGDEAGDHRSAVDSTLATVWDISFATLAEEAPSSIDLLYLCAVLSPEDIPKEMIRRALSLLAAMGHHGVTGVKTLLRPDLFEEALAALMRRSLVEARGDVLLIHRLVQTVTRHRMGVEQRAFWELVATLVVDGMLSDPTVPAAPLLAQTLEAASHDAYGSKTPVHYDSYPTFEHSDCVVVVLSGELDHLTVNNFNSTLERLLTDTDKTIVLDCAELRNISSAGVAAIISFYKLTRDRNRCVVTVGLCNQPLAVMRVLRLDQAVGRQQDRLGP